MMASKPLCVGVIGAGGIAQMMHLPTVAERPDLFKLAALADINPDTLAAVSSRYGIANRFEDADALIAHNEVEAVLLLAAGSHRVAALTALGAGKPVFCEKPLGFGMSETREIAEAARSAPACLMVGYHKRFDPAVERARSAVATMRDLRYVEVTVLHPDDGDYRLHHALLPLDRMPAETIPEDVSVKATRDLVIQPPFDRLVDDIVGRSAPLEKRVAGFLCYDSLIHDFNLIRSFLGEPEEVVSASFWREGFAQTSCTRFPNDVMVNFSWVFLPGLKHYEETIRFVGPCERVTLGFPSPYLRHVPTRLTIERMDGGDLVVEEHTVSYEEAFRAELHHFRNCVLSGRTPATGADDALGDALWIDAVVRSYNRGAPRAASAGLQEHRGAKETR